MLKQNRTNLRMVNFLKSTKVRITNGFITSVPSKVCRTTKSSNYKGSNYRGFVVRFY